MEFDRWRAMRAIEVIWRWLRKFISWLALGKWNRSGKIYGILQVTSNKSHWSYLKKIEKIYKQICFRKIKSLWKDLRNLTGDEQWGPLQFFEEDWGKFKSWFVLGQWNSLGKIYGIRKLMSNESHCSYLKKVEVI